MTESSATVSLEVIGGPSVSVPWTNDMTAQGALEAAWNQINSSAKFTYGLQYYGTTLGYMVFMINETFDSFLSTAAPYFYWEFLVDGKPQSVGIDNTKLVAGAMVTFKFTEYDAGTHAGTTLESKHGFQSRQFAT